MALAVKLSHLTSLAFYERLDQITERTLIIDDLVDGGETRKGFMGHDIAVIHYNKSLGAEEPNFYCAEKKPDTWIVYPWEDTVKAPQDFYDYMKKENRLEEIAHTFFEEYDIVK